MNFHSKRAISPYDFYCDGYSSPGADGLEYFVGFMLGVGSAKLELGHEGSGLLDAINAFDRAEVDDVNIGQINMITVSSFCGLAGEIWGYDVVRSEEIYTKHLHFPKGVVSRNGLSAGVYSAAALVKNTRALFGTVTQKRFPLIPGAHVPCAGKSIKEVGPCHIYCGFGLGIAEDRNIAANLMMEDVGHIPLHISGTNKEYSYKSVILENIAKSILAVGENQKVKYKEIFVEMKEIFIEPGEVGCALVAAPYFTIAKKAVPDENVENLKNITLLQWEKLVFNPNP